jgi:hypothetical protein
MTPILPNPNPTSNLTHPHPPPKYGTLPKALGRIGQGRILGRIGPHAHHTIVTNMAPVASPVPHHPFPCQPICLHEQARTYILLQ